ncbi:MAG: non-hydrolyzing UDP-N-acetylglucosamine 2-epimerase [Nitrosopumilaceae archaeon]
MARNTIKLALVFGTRPQIIKCVPVIRECVKRKIDLTLINTGQHYDFELSKIFFQGLHIPRIKYNLGVGSGSHGWQTGKIMIGVEKILYELKSSACLVPGDTNSAVASALAAIKLKIPVIHLESGLRSFDEFMPEEINRKVIDHVSQLLFAPTRNAEKNLHNEGIPKAKIELSGDTMYDLYLLEKERIAAVQLPNGAEPHQYVVLTLHREENTENPKVLMKILAAVKQFALPVVFPIHPRTKNRLQQFNLFDTAKEIKNLILINPLDYHSMMKLMQKSLFVMTDSGGMQKEAFMVGVPCITLRHNTEWMETVKMGANVLVDRLTRNEILDAMRDTMKDREQIIKTITKAKNPFGTGRAAVKVVKEMVNRF